ncbi:DUF4019 domain-containing protein [Erythrobacter sp.]|uniref:helix-turn-helix domain-containing protein n=1 Tax=Erythrobacter sp. TaxID=1042 RepID=UPI0025D3529D|nr:DUF4019 domain-containing protein [Erythrobacter sp.]
MSSPVDKLTERERETLRLLLNGHDSKSMAAELGISVHTVNDRLREARRKLGVPSSKAAARLLAQHEAVTPPENLARNEMGGALTTDPRDVDASPGAGRGSFLVWLIGGMLMLAIIIAAVAMTAAPYDNATNGEVAIRADDRTGEQPARDWLALIDASDWGRAIETSGRSMRDSLSAQQLAQAVTSAREPFVAIESRTLAANAAASALPGLPAGEYLILEFGSEFSNRKDAVERVVLGKEDGRWKVIGYFIR